jgi:hypothetical protein
MARTSSGRSLARCLVSRRGLRSFGEGLAIAATMGGAASAQLSASHIPTIPRSLGAAVSDDNRTLYTLSSNNAVGVIDLQTDRFVRAIDLNGHAVSPNGVVFCHGKLFIESYTNIVVVNLTDHDSITEIPQSFVVGQTGGDVVTAGDCEAVYCVSGSSDTMYILDPFRAAIVGSVYVGRNNTDVSLSPDVTRAYVVNAQTGMMTLVDVLADRIIDTVDVTGGRPFLNLPMDSAVRSDGMVYVNWVSPDYLSHVSILDPDGGLVRTLDVRAYSTGLSFSLDEQVLFLGGGYAVDSDNGSPVASIPIVSGISQVTFAPSGDRAFITNNNLLYVEAIRGFTPTLTVSGDATIDGTITFDLHAPKHSGRLYQLAAAMDALPPWGVAGVGQWIGEGQFFPLDDDDLFRATITPADPRAASTNDFSGHFGRGDTAQASIRLSSALPGVASGQTIYFAFGTFTGERRSRGPLDVERISNVVAVTIR